MSQSPHHGHWRADRRNLYLHRAALDKLALDPSLRAPCLQLVEAWCAVPSQPARRWLDEWRTMLAEWPTERIAALVLDEARGQSLRQCSPLGPTLTPRERWRLLAEAEAGTDSARVDDDSTGRPTG